MSQEKMNAVVVYGKEDFRYEEVKSRTTVIPLIHSPNFPSVKQTVKFIYPR